MQIKTEVYKFDALYNKILNSRSGEPAIRGKNLTARIINTGMFGGNRQIKIRHYNCDIAMIEEALGGALYIWIYQTTHESVTTKHYLNEILRACNTGVGIFQKDWTWYVTGLDEENVSYRELCAGVGFPLWGSK